MKPLSNDLRQRIIDAYNHGEGSQRTLAQRFSVSRPTVERLCARFKATASVEPAPRRNGPRPIVGEEDFARIDAWIDDQCDLTQQELADRFTSETGRRVSQRTISRVLKRMQQTRKKKSIKPQEALRDDVAAEREAFRVWMQEVDARRLIFVDESGLCRGMRLLYGYAPRGQRAVDRAPTGRGRRLSLIGWLDATGRGEAVWLWDTVKGATFRQFVEEHLLSALFEGAIVIWDNARIHADEELEAMIEARGAELKRLPRYSPEFNPIELLWSKLKHYIRKARADTREALLAALEEAATWITAEDAEGWFEHSGYCHQPT